MRRSTMAMAAVAVAVLLGAQVAGQNAPAAPQRTITPVTDQDIQNPPPQDWLTWRRTLSTWGFSPLDQITPSNVGQLTLAWARGLQPGLQEGTPLVRDGVMFFPNPLDVVQSFDAATGDLRWEYRRRLPEDLNKYFPVPGINRNLAIYGNLIIDTSADDFVYALDATTGQLAWETKILDYTMGAQQTSGPIIANGKIISGRGCEPEGGPDACVITAHDARTGMELWRTRLIPAPGEPGFDTWGDVPFAERRHVGSWMVPSFDPETNLIVVGTSVTSPAPKFMFGSNSNEYLYHNSTLAIDANTGRIVWHYQHVVDHWDLDHPFERMIVETAVTPNRAEVQWVNPRIQAGERRKVITGIPGKTGLVYTLDLRTGEFLWARPTVLQTVISSIDGATGKVTVNPEMLFTAAGQQRFVCPNMNGGKNFQTGAYSPLTNTMFFPLQNTCAEMTATSDRPSLDSLYAVRAEASIAPGTDNVGTIQAISVETGATLWKYEQRAGTASIVATGSGLLFSGDVSGRFRALDQRNGRVLWETNLGAPVTGYPVTYMANGRQYVAVSTGSALATGGTARLTPEIRPANANNLFVFALPAARN
ncbi:MAG: PQQ-binding-like beta-propeller repeat protein [Acidobacteria bacterium]|nr:PQQ-binding-like beta-propeller repeat protein [Acidobacteriota bacterium]